MFECFLVGQAPEDNVAADIVDEADDAVGVQVMLAHGQVLGLKVQVLSAVHAGCYFPE